MSIDALSSLVAVVLAVSLAAERLVTVLKTAFPAQLADEQKTEAQEVDLVADRPRRLLVQLLAFAAAWLTATFLTTNDLTQLGLSSPFKPVQLAAGGAVTLPAYIVGLLASGGSAFWNNVLGYTKALKDTKQVEKASSTLSYHEQADQLGVVAIDSGQAARARSVDAQSTTARTALRQGGQPSFDDAARRNP